MSISKNPMLLFKEEAPEVAKAFDGLIAALSTQPGLDAKTRQLIYIGIKAAQGDVDAVTAHVPMLKAAGGTRDELRDTILVTLTVNGVKGVVSCLPRALEKFDEIQ
ncbi:alkylhydroperoxidase [Leptolinea sp. HRD-7]|nr:alkylhydroperoxidase [Leptolinea sp. HRD-7]